MSASPTNTLMKEAIGYTAASACALLVDMTILWTLVHTLSVGYLAAAAASFLAGAAVAYRLSIWLAFKHHRLRNRRVEFASFVAIGTVGLGINTVVIFTLVNYFGFQVMFAKCVSAGFTFLWNFAARRQLLFVRYPSVS